MMFGDAFRSYLSHWGAGRAQLRSKVMFKITIAAALAAATLVVATDSRASDMPNAVRRAPTYYVAPVASWAGPYVGLYTGFGTNQWQETNTFGSPPAMHMDGWKFGGLVGINWQTGRFVYGFEADLGIDQARFSKSETFSYCDMMCFTSTHTQTIRRTMEGTARLRAGYAVFDNSLVYVTGGLAWSRVRMCDQYSDTFGSSSYCNNSNLLGYAVGAGWEQRLFNTGLSARFEYLFKNENAFSAVSSCSGCGQDYHNALNLTPHTVRGALVYNF
ncbi:porin family protein [Candidatus Kaiserbacteria bacterium]|nr:porin family protein [Candidatus Kaiserbacteria bacterium]